MKNTNHNYSVHNLANAIVLQAVTDYRNAVDSNDQSIISECERFFLSDWFLLLTEVDGEVVLEKLRKERGLKTTRKR